MWLWERVQGMTLAAAVSAGRQTLTEHASLFRYWLQLLAGAVQVRCALSACDCGVER
jgi:LSD1 subclass zinc finger protein